MGQHYCLSEHDEYLIAKPLFVAISMYALFPDELLHEADVADMKRILRERYSALRLRAYDCFFGEQAFLAPPARHDLCRFFR